MSNKPRRDIMAFNVGELGQNALARFDLERYVSGAETMENIIPKVQGGMTKMPGLKRLFETDNQDTGADDRAYLRPFIFSETTNFVLEFLDVGMRIIEGEAYVQRGASDVTWGITWSDASITTPDSGGGSAPSNSNEGLDGFDTIDWTNSRYYYPDRFGRINLGEF